MRGRDGGRLSRREQELARVAVRGGGRERDGDDHDAEVHDHPAVGAADEPAPSLAPGGEHDLAQRRARREPAEPEREKRRQAAGAERHRDDDDAGADPRRPQEPVAQELARRLPPRQHGRDRHEEQQREADRHRHAVEVGPPDRDALAVHRLDHEREHGAEQHDERERGEQHVVGEERALARDRRVDRPRRAQPIARQPIKPTEPRTTMREEREDRGPIGSR